jgi:very-short-patch-repair endonuclease
MRQRLRRNMPKAETLLWARLRGRKVLGYKFRRQFSVGPYSIDFYCPELKLAIEVDGESHLTEQAIASDQERQDYIEAFEIRFLRFTNAQVYKSQNDVVESIVQTVLVLKQKELPPALPLTKRGESVVEKELVDWKT